jgi:glycosyltransferase involved in cell wall biosynthesis
VKIALLYDCLYPYNVGGAERWYRALAERLANERHEVTYITLHQWPRGTEPDLPGVRVVSVGPRLSLYVRGRRRILPPVVYGVGLLAHLLVRGRRYDVVHTASFPYFSLLAAAAVRPLGRYRLVVDWIEIWTRDYWREYLGRVGGGIGWRIQRICARVPHRAFAISRLSAERVAAEGHSGAVTVLPGLYAGSAAPDPARDEPEPLVVFAGRHIPEKQVTAIVPAVARARERLPALRAEIFGDGPDREHVLRQIHQHGLKDMVSAPGFVAGERVAVALSGALCLVLPSRREGYGLVVVEAAAAGTPSIVVRGPDNAATELVVDGENGFVATSADPGELARLILSVHERGAALRRSTRERREARSSMLAGSFPRCSKSVTRSSRSSCRRPRSAR